MNNSDVKPEALSAAVERLWRIVEAAAARDEIVDAPSFAERVADEMHALLGTPCSVAIAVDEASRWPVAERRNVVETVLSEVGEPRITRLLVCDGPLLLATLSVSESTGSRYEADVLGQLARPARVALRAERSRTDLETRLHRARERWNLTPRHVDALRSLALGHSNKELAAALHVTRRTAEQHVADMLARTGSESRLQLVSRLWRES